MLPRKSLMLSLLTSRSLRIAAVFVLFCLTAIAVLTIWPRDTTQLLSDPFLQLPSATSVRVVWFTEFAGSRHSVAYGQNLSQTAVATTTKLSRTREDQNSRVGKQTKEGQVYKKPTQRDIWRHEAEIPGLTPGTRVPYQVTSVREDGKTASSDAFTLAPNPTLGTPLKILLTSDHQLKPMTAANLQMVAKTVGRVDAVFLAGDAINVADRASEWFDDNRGGAFFPCLQGRARYELEYEKVGKTLYRGGELIQHAPLFTAIGNHEVMGRFSMEKGLSYQFDDTFPRAAAQQNSGLLNQSNDPTVRDRWLKDNSFNTDTYEEIFTLPQSSQGGDKYYAVTFGDVRLVVLYVSNMWRTPNLDARAKGKYREREQELNIPDKWGYGQHIFEPIAKGSAQYSWLVQELNSPEFRQAKYKVVMMHDPPHSLGENIVPGYTDPVQVVDRNANGSIKAIRYEYPKQADYIIRDVVPMLEAAGVQLVFYGHSHLWNRFISPSGMHFLETSNVGNTYKAFVGEEEQNCNNQSALKRNVPANYKEEYAKTGDPNGLQPVMPTIAPLKGQDGKPMPYIASDCITAFSIFDTATGTVSSYRFDTREPKSRVVKFDEFNLK